MLQATLREKLEKRLKSLEKVRVGSERQLSNEKFLAKAPPKVDYDLVLQIPESQAGALREKLEKRLKSLEKVRVGSERQLSNEKFLAKAPPKVVESIRSKMADYESQIERIRKSLEGLG